MTMPATRREAMKLNTRQRVLDAARALFSERGYAAATIREIAVRAGVSTGSVFTTFESKEEILSVIVLERYEELVAALDKARTQARGSARDRLKAAVAAAYRYEFSRLLLIVEQIGASWTWSKDFERASRDGIMKPFHFIQETLKEAKSEGAMRSDVDMDMFADIILGIYLRNFRHAWYQSWSLEETVEKMHLQIDLLFDGVGPRQSPKKG